MEKFLDRQALLDQFVQYAAATVLKGSGGFKTSGDIIHTQIKYIARKHTDNKGFYPIWEKIDTTLKYAIDFLEKIVSGGSFLTVMLLINGLLHPQKLSSSSINPRCWVFKKNNPGIWSYLTFVWLRSQGCSYHRTYIHKQGPGPLHNDNLGSDYHPV